MVKQRNLSKPSISTQHAYQQCQNIARNHYENFPVASVLLPKHLRRSIAAIYAFARTADDIADEGTICRETRLELMTRYEANLYDIQYGKPPTEPIFIALKHTIESFNLPIQLFYDLLTAFRQDILKDRYNNFSEVRDYCHYSANPIGRLLLHLSGQATRENLIYSDHICTGLQLINFIQDISIDLNHKNRCYIPLDELEAYNVKLSEVGQNKVPENYASLVQKQLQRAKEIYQQGIPLGQNLPGFFGIEIRFITACGLRILEKLHNRKNIFDRPVMSKKDMLLVLGKVLLARQNPAEMQVPALEKL
jgi:squalene synthase HpnC